MNVNQLSSRSETKARDLFFVSFRFERTKVQLNKFGTPNFVVVDWIGHVVCPRDVLDALLDHTEFLLDVGRSFPFCLILILFSRFRLSSDKETLQ